MKPKYNVRLKMKDGEWITIDNVYDISPSIIGSKIKFHLSRYISSDEFVAVDEDDISIKEIRKIN